MTNEKRLELENLLASSLDGLWSDSSISPSTSSNLAILAVNLMAALGHIPLLSLVDTDWPANRISGPLSASSGTWGLSWFGRRVTLSGDRVRDQVERLSTPWYHFEMLVDGKVIPVPFSWNTVGDVVLYLPEVYFSKDGVTKARPHSLPLCISLH